MKKAEYSYYPGLDNLHALVDQDDKVYFAHSDGMGNVVGLVSDTKVLSRTYDYDLKGNLVGLGDIKPFSDRDRARFKGALWMGPEVDLYYMRNRWYEVHSGRFLSEDPIGLQGGINVYSFAGGNPVSGRDPLGLCDPTKDPECPFDLPGVTVTAPKFDSDGTASKLRLLWLGRGLAVTGRSGRRGFRGSRGGRRGGQQQRQSCTLNSNFLRQLDQQFDLAAQGGRERGGFYGAPWSSPLRHTATGGPDYITVPLRPGAAGYWHTHQNPATTHIQRPSPADSNWTVSVANSTNIVVARDSLWIISQSGSITGCGR